MTEQIDAAVPVVKSKSPIRAILSFANYFWMIWLLVAALRYAMCWLRAYGQATANRPLDDHTVPPLDLVSEHAFMLMDATVSTIHFSIFIAVCSVGAILCRK